MTPTQWNNKLIAEYAKSGDADEVARRYAMAYLLMTTFVAYIDDIDDILRKHGLRYGELKFRANNLQAAFNQYNTTVKPCIDEYAFKLLTDEYDAFRDACDRFMESGKTADNFDPQPSTAPQP